LFGKLAGKEFVIEKEKLDIIKKHMEGFLGDDIENAEN